MPLYKTTFKFSILSDRPLGAQGMDDIFRVVEDGEQGGSVWLNDLCLDEQQVSLSQMKDLLIQAGSDPGFFGFEHEEEIDEDPEDDEGAEDDPKAQYDEDPID